MKRITSNLASKPPLLPIHFPDEPVAVPLQRESMGFIAKPSNFLEELRRESRQQVFKEIMTLEEDVEDVQEDKVQY